MRRWRICVTVINLDNVKPEPEPLRQHDAAQSNLKIDVRVRRDDRPGLVAGLGVARRAVGQLRREFAPPRAADVHVREEALLQSRRDLLLAELHFNGLLEAREFFTFKIIKPGDVCGEIASGAYIAKRRTPDARSRS